MEYHPVSYLTKCHASSTGFPFTHHSIKCSCSVPHQAFSSISLGAADNPEHKVIKFQYIKPKIMTLLIIDRYDNRNRVK